MVLGVLVLKENFLRVSILKHIRLYLYFVALSLSKTFIRKNKWCISGYANASYLLHCVEFHMYLKVITKKLLLACTCVVIFKIGLFQRYPLRLKNIQ